MGVFLLVDFEDVENVAGKPCGAGKPEVVNGDDNIDGHDVDGHEAFPEEGEFRPCGIEKVVVKNFEQQFFTSPFVRLWG